MDLQLKLKLLVKVRLKNTGWIPNINTICFWKHHRNNLLSVKLWSWIWQAKMMWFDWHLSNREIQANGNDFNVILNKKTLIFWWKLLVGLYNFILLRLKHEFGALESKQPALSNLVNTPFLSLSLGLLQCLLSLTGLIFVYPLLDGSPAYSESFLKRHSSPVNKGELL